MSFIVSIVVTDLKASENEQTNSVELVASQLNSLETKSTFLTSKRSLTDDVFALASPFANNSFAYNELKALDKVTNSGYHNPCH